MSSVYGFRWFRRFGADNTWPSGRWPERWWAIVSLSLVAIIGLGVAAQEGASLDLVPVLIGTFVVIVGIGSLFVYERPLHAVRVLVVSCPSPSPAAPGATPWR